MTVLAIVAGGMIDRGLHWLDYLHGRPQRPRAEKAGGSGSSSGRSHPDQLLKAMEEPEAEARLRRLVKAGVIGAVLLTCSVHFL